jgi:hypothetical protein
MPADEQQPTVHRRLCLARRVLLGTTVLALVVLIVPGGAGASTSDLAACGPSGRATVNPKQTPTSIDLNQHRSVGFDYVVSQCNPNDQDIHVRVEGLDNPSAVSGSFESAGDGVGFLHLVFNRSAIDAGSTDIRIVITGDPVRTSILTLTLDKRSPMWIAGLIALAACVGGLLLFGLRTLESNAGWWRAWQWKAFQPVAGILVLIASVGAALGVLFGGGLATNWTAGSDWWSFFLKIGTATIGGATAIAATGAAHSAAAAPTPAPAPLSDSAAVDSTGHHGVTGATDPT